jgi:hypothetical protein
MVSHRHTNAHVAGFRAVEHIHPHAQRTATDVLRYRLGWPSRISRGCHETDIPSGCNNRHDLFLDRLNGVYDETTKQICLAKLWHASSVKIRGVLLHELIHHVQFESKNWLCPKATEWEAYKMQEAWLLENGMRPKFNWVYILLDSSCSPRDIHP